jgi:pimeloyl-ACP methyl ester carboxylesterase
MGREISETFREVAGIRIFCREVAGDGPPAIFVHGNPTHSADWIAFLERIEGPAVAFDLPGFGRSDRPDPTVFDYSVGAYSDLIADLFVQLAPGGYRLVVHDWGVLGLVAAQQDPGKALGLVVINAVPLNAGYRWHWAARIWRRRGPGEAANALSTKRGMALVLRLARPGRKSMPRGFVEMVWSGWDAGMRRAILGLYRSADPEVLAAAGARLGDITCPALVVWGVGDPYLPAREARAFAAALPGSELVELERAGHWPWIDRPELVDRVVAFLGSSAEDAE